MASRTLQLCPLSNNSQITMDTYVRITYFTINNMFIFLFKGISMGNLLSQLFNGFTM